MKRKNVFLSCVLSLVCCISLLVGSTFALFTSEKEIDISINAGNVEVEATIENVALYSPTSIADTGDVKDGTNAASETAFANGGTAVFDGEKLVLSKMTPGDEVTFQIKITNLSDVKVKYRTKITLVEDNELFKGLAVKIGENYDGNICYSSWTEFTQEGEEIVLDCSVALPTTAENEYKKSSCTISFGVEAVQGNFVDSGKPWTGETDDEGLAENTDAEEKIVKIGTAEELASFAAAVNAGNTYAGYTVMLTANIDLNNLEWTAIGSSNNPFSGSFDGQGYTISNLKIEKTVGNIAASNRQGLFSTVKPSGATYLKNLEVRNVEIVAGYHVGGVVATCDESSQSATGNYFVMSDIKLTGSVKIYGWEGVGGVMGSGNMAEISNITVDVEEGSYVTTMPDGRTNSFACVGSVKGGGYFAKADNITSNMDVTAKTAGTGGLFGVIGGQTVACYVSNLFYSGKVTLTESSVDKTRGYSNYQYNGLLVGAPRFTLIADEATCSSTGTLELHTETSVETSNHMADVFVWGGDLFGASRDYAYTNKSYSKEYAE